MQARQDGERYQVVASARGHEVLTLDQPLSFSVADFEFRRDPPG